MVDTIKPWMGLDLIGVWNWYHYHLVMTNIAMENTNHKWRFLAGKIIYICIYKYGQFSMALLNNQRVDAFMAEIFGISYGFYMDLWLN